MALKMECCLILVPPTGYIEAETEADLYYMKRCVTRSVSEETYRKAFDIAFGDDTL